MQTEQDNSLAVIENSLDVLKTGPEILRSNRDRGAKAVVVGKNILAAIVAGGMTPELDERASKYLVNCSAALKEMKEHRSSVSQIMDELKKMFTSVENDLDAKKDGTAAFQLQAERNKFAKKLADEEKKRREEAEIKAARQQAIITIRIEAEKQLSGFVTNLVTVKKSQLTSAFNLATFENVGEFEAKINAYKPQDVKIDWSKFSYVGPYSISLSNDEIKETVAEVVSEEFKQLLIAGYIASMKEHRDDLIEKLPSKLSELEEEKRLADEAADAKSEEEKHASLERIRQMEEDKKRREDEESDRIENEATAANAKAAQDAEIKKQGDQTLIMFDKEAAIAEVAPAPETRGGYLITVLHPAGYAQLFQFWFEKEGNKLPIDKIGKTSLDQMKAFCEKQAHKNNEKIESKLLRYDETLKAVNRKEVGNGKS